MYESREASTVGYVAESTVGEVGRGQVVTLIGDLVKEEEAKGAVGRLAALFTSPLGGVHLMAPLLRSPDKELQEKTLEALVAIFSSPEAGGAAGAGGAAAEALRGEADALMARTIARIGQAPNPDDAGGAWDQVCFPWSPTPHPSLCLLVEPAGSSPSPAPPRSLSTTSLSRVRTPSGPSLRPYWQCLGYPPFPPSHLFLRPQWQ